MGRSQRDSTIHASARPDDGTARALVSADEAAADAARTRYRALAMKSLRADRRVGPLLAPGERVVAVRRLAVVDRRQPTPDPAERNGPSGMLYVTSRRVIIVGDSMLDVGLESVDEVVVSDERVRLLLRGGHGVTLQVAQPRLLRVEIAAARAAARMAAGH